MFLGVSLPSPLAIKTHLGFLFILELNYLRGNSIERVVVVAVIIILNAGCRAKWDRITG